MQRLLTFAILLTSTLSLHAQGQQQNVAKLKAEARNAVSIIGSDKDKTQSYCEIVDLLGRQLGQADQKKDKKKTKALSQRINQLQKKLGSEFFVLENILDDIDLKSPDGREIALNPEPQSILSGITAIVQASPTKCGKNIVVAYWANDRSRRPATI